ncbi:MAG TPA: BlaI/MecI/CopY family transcriptional regulator [Acetivibrio sp.]|uniref:BlaI/MecI/CopY family transcriptional regulator n=1 Tax=Acetivibrio sp. TaxID=1872092 RepID=UPI002CBC2A82|nr:BlaI/MecI/CopY family transcriptional regulator [Acetivibrio sp.]HOM02409.1 BlaI/MecI/CopY family transcriptional regulator [Acetivibrio sp.]
MKYYLNDSEYRFMCIVWDVEPINSMELVKICYEKLGWKKSTTFTVIRNLCKKEILSNENAVVKALVSRDSIQKQEVRDFLDKKFQGSLPAFISAFLQDKKLTREEAEYLQRLIDDTREGE